MKRRKLSNLNLIVVHTLATPQITDTIGVEQVRKWHTDPKPQGRGWDDIGYNYVIRRTGVAEAGRPLEYIPAHAGGYNKQSIGIALAGGLMPQNPDGTPGEAVDNYAEIQKMTLRVLINSLTATFPQLEYLCGHRDLSPDKDGDGVIEQWEWRKQCPCFEVWSWYITGNNPAHPARILKPYNSATHG